MDRFHIIAEAEAIISAKGVFRQVKLFRRGDGLYFGHGSGFVRLYGGGNTGVPNVRWDDIEIPGLSKAELKPDGLNKLSIPQGKLIEAK